MEWSIVEIARLAGTTSRTLRHYGDVGLLVPSRVGKNGYRYYDEQALVRLQRILLLRELGLGIPAIVEVMDGQRDSAHALAIHLEWLAKEKERLDRQIASVELTIRNLEGGKQLMAEQMFDGFDHTRYRDEVEETWGADAYRKGERWWKSKSKEEQRAYRAQHAEIAADYQKARDAGESAESVSVQAIVARHVDWLNLTAEITGGAITAQRLRGYGDMYVGDPRFAKNYGGLDGAEFVRDAFTHYATNNL
ncbi:MAG: MerR family transcriptional regulator, thiopeptide resistance regulator [Actinomycetota bacterium]|jgi:DNA-binding transcriptional MerR regulator|nr:MerR family transcriptional regulator, thiopeptide resistance regulator [Actinomycetota bacterium]